MATSEKKLPGLGRRRTVSGMDWDGQRSGQEMLSVAGVKSSRGGDSGVCCVLLQARAHLARLAVKRMQVNYAFKLFFPSSSSG
jgi:hypothetical protein